MLSDLNKIQDGSEESVQRTELSVSVQTRTSVSGSNDGDGELIERVYTFSHAVEWEKWVLQEYIERRSVDVVAVDERDWTREEHLIWTDVHDTRDIIVPSEVSERLSMMTGADEIVVQIPRGSSVGESSNEYEIVQRVSE
jgi:hypothetical protein